MPLEIKKLANRVDLADGTIRTRCPACAELGQDKQGDHLRVYPDGRFGCCVFPRDREHRKRIFALAGEHSRQGIKVHVTPVKTTGAVQTGILGRLGRVFPTPTAVVPSSDASDGAAQFGAQCRDDPAPVRTLRTGIGRPNHDSTGQGVFSIDESRTPRTGSADSYVYLEGAASVVGANTSTLKGHAGGVRGVREGAGDEGLPESAANQGPMPYYTPGGTLVIPFDSPERFHYWKPGGQSLKQTAAEARSRLATEGLAGDGTDV